LVDQLEPLRHPGDLGRVVGGTRAADQLDRRRVGHELRQHLRPAIGTRI
jgi:hypothetical protein